jgi:hypothetical protein
MFRIRVGVSFTGNVNGSGFIVRVPGKGGKGVRASVWG